MMLECVFANIDMLDFGVETRVYQGATHARTELGIGSNINKHSSRLHRASLISKHYLFFQLMHTIYKYAAIIFTASIPTSTENPYL
jgi:hypothetical protein